MTELRKYSTMETLERAQDLIDADREYRSMENVEFFEIQFKKPNTDKDKKDKNNRRITQGKKF